MGRGLGPGVRVDGQRTWYGQSTKEWSLPPLDPSRQTGFSGICKKDLYCRTRHAGACRLQKELQHMPSGTAGGGEELSLDGGGTSDSECCSSSPSPRQCLAGRLTVHTPSVRKWCSDPARIGRHDFQCANSAGDLSEHSAQHCEMWSSSHSMGEQARSAVRGGGGWGGGSCVPWVPLSHLLCCGSALADCPRCPCLHPV